MEVWLKIHRLYSQWHKSISLQVQWWCSNAQKNDLWEIIFLSRNKNYRRSSIQPSSPAVSPSLLSHCFGQFEQFPSFSSFYLNKILHSGSLPRCIYDKKRNRRSSSSNSIALFEWWNIANLFSNELTAEISCWIYSSERQLARMRLAFLRSVLNQEVGAFDTDLTTATIITGVTNHMSVIQDAIGEKVMDFTIIWSSNTTLLNFGGQTYI